MVSSNYRSGNFGSRNIVAVSPESDDESFSLSHSLSPSLSLSFPPSLPPSLPLSLHPTDLSLLPTRGPCSKYELDIEEGQFKGKFEFSLTGPPLRVSRMTCRKGSDFHHFARVQDG